MHVWCLKAPMWPQLLLWADLNIVPLHKSHLPDANLVQWGTWDPVLFYAYVILEGERFTGAQKGRGGITSCRLHASVSRFSC